MVAGTPGGSARTITDATQYLVTGASNRLVSSFRLLAPFSHSRYDLEYSFKTRSDDQSNLFDGSLTHVESKNKQNSPSLEANWRFKAAGGVGALSPTMRPPLASDFSTDSASPATIRSISNRAVARRGLESSG